MGEWQDMPAWLAELAAGTWEQRHWDAWERVWKPALAKRGVKPEMLERVGEIDRPPLMIAAASPDFGWRSAPFDWNRHNEAEVILYALRGLVDAFDPVDAA